MSSLEKLKMQPHVFTYPLYFPLFLFTEHYLLKEWLNRQEERKEGEKERRKGERKEGREEKEEKEGFLIFTGQIPFVSYFLLSLATIKAITY